MGQSCDINGKKHVHFQDVKTILDQNQCNSCHFKLSKQTEWYYDNYDDVFKLSRCNEPIIVRGNPSQSILIDKLNGGPTACGNPMPLGRNKISNDDLIALETWISLGAPEFCVPVYDEIRAILDANHCSTCHKGNNQWKYDSYSEMFKKPTTSICLGDEIIKYSAKESLLYKKISLSEKVCGDYMYVNGVPMSTKDVSIIRDWINAGAPELAKALPVTLSNINTSNINNEEILLLWKTDAELNTSHFDIEYSIDGTHFFNVGRIESDSPITGHEYSFVYKNPAIGYNYFRLKMVDHDGQHFYSPTRVERISNTSEIFRINPNPVIKSAASTVEWYSTDNREKTLLLLVNIDGRVVKQFVINNGINIISFENVQNGVYYLSIEDYFFSRSARRVVVLDY